jgi:hypothetical protein
LDCVGRVEEKHFDLFEIRSYLGRAHLIQRFSRFPWNIAGLFILIRIMFVLATPIEGLRGYGDFIHYYRLAELGTPFLDYWMEHAPIFSFLSRLLFVLSGGGQHIYDYLLFIILSFVQMGSIILFCRLAQRLFSDARAVQLGWVYFAILSGLSYGWWYFDPISVFTVLLGLNCLLEGKDLKAGLALGVGILTKWFPALVFPFAWKARPQRRALLVIGLALSVTVLVFGTLYLLSPDFTTSSIRSQSSKGSWETIWALIDGNLSTGNFGPLSERFDPEAALQLRGNPAKINPLLTLLGFAVVGVWIFNRVKSKDTRVLISFLGLTWCMFLLWSPGWSPQWILHLIPLILLTLDIRQSVFFSLNLILVSLMEWPVLLSRGRFDLLWLPVVIRTFLLVVLGIVFAGVALSAESEDGSGGVT